RLSDSVRHWGYWRAGAGINSGDEPDLTMHVEILQPSRVGSSIYVDGESKQHLVKRFEIETTTLDKDFVFITESIGSRLVYVSTAESPEVEVEVSKGKGKGKAVETINLEEFIEVRGWKALGNRLTSARVLDVRPVGEPETPTEPDEEEEAVEVEKPASKAGAAKKAAAVKKKEASPQEQTSRLSEAPPERKPQSHQNGAERKKPQKNRIK